MWEKNSKNYPHILQQIKDQGHSIGNHTYNHLQGWKTPTDKYIKNILRAESYLYDDVNKKQQKLFRPPHGRIRPVQAKLLRKKGYKIIMWDVLSGDFDQSLSKELCLEHTLKHITNGSIVVFHDSDKSFKNLDYVLPKVLEHFTQQGYQF